MYQKIIDKIDELVRELDEINRNTNPSSLRLGWDKLERWKERSVKEIDKLISIEEGNKLKEKRLTVFSMSNPRKNFSDTINLYHSHLIALRDEIKENAEFIIGNSNLDGKLSSILDITESPLKRIEMLCRNFHKVARQLRDRYNSRSTIMIEDEYDLQDLMHALLKIDFDDIRPEEWTESYAGKSSRIDFLLKKEKVVVETKKTNKNLSEKEIGDQLLIDINRYKEHGDCKTLVCFIYDPEGRIGNPVGLINDLEKNSSKDLLLKVFIEPK